MKRLKIAALLLAGASLFPTHSVFASDGWGRHQTKDTITGLILGGTIGGIVGHQQNKQKEGIIIGSVLGSIIGNKGGKGRDSREHYYSNDSRYSRYNESRSVLYQRPGSQRYNYSETIITDPEVLAAQQRAEALEKEVQLERERIAAQQRREAQLKEMRAREAAALAELNKLRKK